MKVAIVYHFFAHYRGPIIEELKHDDEIDYYFIAGSKPNSRYSSLKLHEFADTDNFIEVKNTWIGGYFLWQSGLKDILRSEKFDGVIFLGDWKFLSTWRAVWHLSKSQTLCFFWGHGLLNRSNDLNKKIKLFFLNRFKNGGFLYSNRARQIMVENGYTKDLFIIYNSLDYKTQLSVVNGNSGFSDGAVVPYSYLIFSGRLVRQRKLEQLVDAVSLLRENNVKVSVIIVGDGPHRDILQLYVEEMSLSEHFVFLGACYDEAKLGFYFINALACVYPGPIGLALIHALTYGVPVITNDNLDHQKPEIEALKHGFNGFMFKEDDIHSLAEQISKIINLTADERSKLRVNAKKIVHEKYNPESQASIFRNVLKSKFRQ